MSLCNIPVEPTDVCEHMIPKGLPCATCSELKSSREERLLSGKDQSIKLFKYFTHKFDKLEKWCTYVVELYSKKIGKLEDAYEADAQVARDIIFEGAKRNERQKDLEERIKKLEALNQQCFDANPISEIEKRFDENEMGLQSHYDSLLSLDKRITDVLEVCVKEDDFYGFRVEIRKNIDEIQAQLDVIRKVGVKVNNKKPHPCPLCEGKGYWHKIENNISCGGRCNTCEGKGIVWG